MNPGGNRGGVSLNFAELFKSPGNGDPTVPKELVPATAGKGTPCEAADALTPAVAEATASRSRSGSVAVD